MIALIIGLLIGFFFGIAILAPAFTHELIVAAITWVRSPIDERARTARRIREINNQTNAAITHLQYGYWEAQQQMREELDCDG